MPRQVPVALSLAFGVAFALAATVPAARQDPRQRIGVTCTFANPSYAGDCVEKTTRAEKEKPAAACKPILDCLNNSRCARSYCRATTIRQGWSLEKAE